MPKISRACSNSPIIKSAYSRQVSQAVGQTAWLFWTLLYYNKKTSQKSVANLLLHRYIVFFCVVSQMVGLTFFIKYAYDSDTDTSAVLY